MIASATVPSATGCTPARHGIHPFDQTPDVVASQAAEPPEPHRKAFTVESRARRLARRGDGLRILRIDEGPTRRRLRDDQPSAQAARKFDRHSHRIEALRPALRLLSE